jgi:CheY-like chemotaxis protein
MQAMDYAMPEASGTTILVVDDHPDSADLVARLLETAGYVVLQADSARQAVERLDDNGDIALVLSDIRMPDVDGFDFLRLVRQRHPGLPMVLMTGLPITNEDFVPRGARILQKPFGMDQLKRVVFESLSPNPSPE